MLELNLVKPGNQGIRHINVAVEVELYAGFLKLFSIATKLFHLDHGGLTEKKMEVFFLSDISIYFS